MLEASITRTVTPSPSPLSLRALLRAQPLRTLERLLALRDVAIDRAKQLDEIEQAARALCLLPSRLLETFDAGTRAALDSLVLAPGMIERQKLGGAALRLVDLGILHAHPLRPDVLVLPGAYRLQFPAPATEDPHTARALLSSLDVESRQEVMTTYYGRRAYVPWPLALEPLLQELESEEQLDARLASLDRNGMLTLAAVEARGGDIEVSAFLDLCLEPARWSGSRIPKRGLAHHLVTHGFAFVRGDRVVLPTEVGARVGRERRATLEKQRAAAITRTADREDEPQRAALGEAPGPRAMALWLESYSEKGPTRSSVSKASRRAGLSFDAAHLLATLAHAIPLRAHTLTTFGRALVRLWLRGQLWDELAQEPRIRESDSPSPAITLLRSCVLDSLRALPPGRFAERSAVIAAVQSDLRYEGIVRAHEAHRAREKTVVTLEEGLERILDVSLRALGLVDAGRDTSMRLARWVDVADAPEREAAPQGWQWESPLRVRVSSNTELLPLLQLAGFVDAVADGASMVLQVDAMRVSLNVQRDLLDALSKLGCPDLDAVEAAFPSPRGKGFAFQTGLVIQLEAGLADEVRALPALAKWLVPAEQPSGVLMFTRDAPVKSVLRVLQREGLDIAPPVASRRR